MIQPLASSAEISDALAGYKRRYCPVCDNLHPRAFLPGPGGRPNARCRECNSLERHRFFVVLLGLVQPMLSDLGTLLEVAPSPETSPFLARLGARRHVRLDLGADPRTVDLWGSLTALPLASDSVDLLVCYHVLEHIPDDRAAMQEIARVLAPNGIGLVQVPFRPDTVTDEDPDAPEAERIRRFGQRDHVRYYGDDFEDRLVAAGLSIERVSPRSLLGDAASTWMHLNPDEIVWIVRPRTGARVPAPLLGESTTLTRSFDAMLRQMVTHRSDLTRARAKVAGLRQKVRAQADAATASPSVKQRARHTAGRAARAVRRLREGLPAQRS